MPEHSAEELVALAHASINNRSGVEKKQKENGLVACYYCVEFLPAVEVNQYCSNEKREEITAICPRCDADTILAVPVDLETLQELYNIYFAATE